MEYSNYNNNNNNNNDIYIQLIKNFENHLITNEKKEAIYNYMKNYTEKNFSNDIIFILEDYNNIISQSIQAIKSLLAENERLNENNIIFLQNNLSYPNKHVKYSNNNINNNNNNINNNNINNINNGNNNNINNNNDNNNLNINLNKENDAVDSIRINIQNSRTIDSSNLKKPLREIFKNNLNINKKNNNINNSNSYNNIIV